LDELDLAVDGTLEDTDDVVKPQGGACDRKDGGGQHAEAA
jgi:hypothetical protein